MADAHGEEGGRDLEAPEEELDEHEQALLHFSAYSESRRALPWAQWTFREKANYYMDRAFLGLLIVFLLMLLGEFGYKMGYVMKITRFMPDWVADVFAWLFTQDRQEELAEL